MNMFRKEGESFAEYQYRLYEDREDLGLSNQQIADLLNHENNTEYDESKYRKEYQIFKNVWEPMFKEQHTASLPNEYLEELTKEQLKMNEKNRAITKMLQDQRREYRKLLDFSGRFEHIKDEIFSNISALPTIPTPPTFPTVEEQDKELIVLMSDWHIGAEYDGRFGKYNVKIAKERVRYYLSEVLNEIKIHGHNKVHLAHLGDGIGGNIHISSRVAASEDAVQQLMILCELLTEFVSEVAKVVPDVSVYSVVGNHGRLIPQKDAVRSHEENFEKLIIWHLQARLANYKNITFHEDRDGLVEANVLGESVVFAHGDLDKIANGSDKLAQMLSYVPQWIFIGHVHHSFEKNFGITTVIVNPSGIGHDSYSASGRFGGRAGQKMVTFEKSKLGGINHSVKLINFN
ncbi:TPA: hypothetical protein I1827_000860 [Staphylococcus pseudintermedius]|uniref:metallophosphoesterase family protein n=2 Tax=Staphylococcus pseudintermedius TaxID=283734 RepID=UPI00112027AD|nr:metallophosphoesterase family protein [Staphylococcus pseudintermedius]EGQ1746949.1 hypothetical protein [Staphylococcus pseudintermedius]EGQ2764097.1 hypothetical protein [Staphylococcus pseudintermedius]EGQ2813182.1 hypothetical protein [Staphylococcus pseudintermedius]EGQ3033357.1 hypothetical protein [Staphylococcus pseudintermedius]EGQ3621602.1 hypothetical protein [Staphylococcus pseudintermedius]